MDIPVIIYLGVTGLIAILAGVFKKELQRYFGDAYISAAAVCMFWPIIAAVLIALGIGLALFKCGEKIRKICKKGEIK